MKSLIYNKPIHVLLFSFLLSCSHMAAQVRVVDNKGTISTIPIDWTRVLGTTKDIYNTDQGNVGIGTKTPKATFHNAGSTILGAKASAVLSSSTALTDADIADFTVFNYSASASGLALTLPTAMTDVTPGRMVTIANTDATNSFSVSGVLLPAGYAQAFVWNGFGWSAQSSPVALAVPFSGLTAATVNNTLDNTNYAQTWNWTTADTQNPLTMNVPALTTGQALNITGGSALTSGSLINATAAVGATTTMGLLNIANTAASTTGTVATIQANSTAGSGLTVLANGNVGVGISAPEAALHLQAGTVAAGTAPLKLTSGTNLTTAESGAVEFDGNHFYGTAGTNRLTLDNSALTGIAGGAAQAQTVDNSISALTKGMTVTWVPTASNTAADPTLAVGTATAITVKKSGTASLAANDIALDVAATAVYDGTNWQLQNPQSATAWALTGNAGTSAGTNFMGTTDNVDVVFKRNGTLAGLLNLSKANTSWGVDAFNTTATGANNSAFGYQALTLNTTGYANTAIGRNTLSKNTTGAVNTAVGNIALNQNTTGSFNAALGNNSGGSITTGSRNVVLGNLSGLNITTGNNNIAIGHYAEVPSATADNQLSIGNSIYGLGMGTATPKIGIGLSAPAAALHLLAGTAAAGTAPLKLNSGTNLTMAESGAVEFDGSHFYGTAGTNRLTLDNSALTGTAGGAAQAQTVSNTISALTTGMTVTWVPTVSNTAADPTLAVGTATAITVKKSYNGALAALAASDIVSGVAATAAYDGTNWVLQNPQTGGSLPISSLTGAVKINSINNYWYQQTWDWSNASTENPLILSASTLTTGNLLSLTGGSTLTTGSLIKATAAVGATTTKGLLNIANTAASSTGKVATIQANSTPGSGLTVLANGNVGVGISAPEATLHLQAGTAAAGTAPLKLSSGTNLTTAESGAVEFDGNHFYGTAGTNRLTLDNSALTGIAGGAAQAQTVGNSISALTTGMTVTWVPTASNTAADPTLAVGTATAKTVKKSGTASLAANDIALGVAATAVYDGTNWQLQNPQSATAWSLTGNAGTSAATNFMGTTDDVDVVFKRKGILAGLLNKSLNNTSWGVDAFNTTATGTNNSAFGYQALTSNNTGSYNAAVGYTALYVNTTGSYNVAVGRGTLKSNTTEQNNTAVGDLALSMATASNNTAVGSGALRYSTTGGFNTALGTTALYSNTTGGFNTALGNGALFNSTTAIGSTAVGSGALNGNTTGANNTGLGRTAGNTITTGSTNIAIGYNAQVPTATADNQLSIGNSIYGLDMGTATPKIGIGNSLPTVALDVTGDVKVSGVLSTPSDMRLKKDIETLTDVLSKIEQLRGVRYEYKDQQKYAVGPQVGVIAQELQKVFPELVRTDPDGFLSVNYSQLTGVLIQAVKEQQQEIDLLKKQMKQVMEKLNIN